MYPALLALVGAEIPERPRLRWIAGPHTSTAQQSPSSRSPFRPTGPWQPMIYWCSPPQAWWGPLLGIQLEPWPDLGAGI